MHSRAAYRRSRTWHRSTTTGCQTPYAAAARGLELLRPGAVARAAAGGGAEQA
jgi:hypothetical protein